MKCILSGYGAYLETSLALFADHRGTPLWTEGIESPSFMATGDGYLFTLTENRHYAVLYAYRKEGISYRLTDRRTLDGTELCHLAYSSQNKRLLGACYGSGHVLNAAFDPETGLFGDVQSIPQGGRQHCVLFNQAQDRLFTVNLGLDQVIVYDIQDGLLNEVRRIDAPKGSGPRHAKLSPDEQRLYVITEYSNQILVYDTQDWSMKQEISTLPENHFGASHCSTLCFSRDGRFLYAANRYADTIAVLDVAEDGSLAYRTAFDCGGRSPRHMEITPDGRDLVICCQDSDWVVFKRLSKETGLPVSTVRELPVLAPACVVFVP